MIESHAFRTQARTVDHLGREQIADCPTAISELWKNSYDAYARRVSLHIFDDPVPVASILDDGHGMSYEEFINRWLVVGTESKYSADGAVDEDRDGLPKREKQGQKGIGRLSSANIGPLLLVVSKRANKDFVAALVDWRIFENPYLVLSDIEIPVTKFAEKTELFEQLPELFERLVENIWGSNEDAARRKRLELAWEAYDRLIAEEDDTKTSPSSKIANTIVDASFSEHHIEQWVVWRGDSKKGTALLVADINYDLCAQLPSIEPDVNVDSTREQFHSTLSAFTDPYVDQYSNEKNSFDPGFRYEVKVWSSGVPKTIVEDDRGTINRSVTEEMEHVLSGSVDENGVFRGQVKAFGEWRKQGADYVIYPPDDFKIPRGPKTFVGSFGLHLATFELSRSNSTLSDQEHNRYMDLAQQHSGFLVFRNGLRVLPYGRIDNDFFQIEMRRSKNAGREFWNSRRMFGRVAISREANPNLRDKAGREGFIDNRSAKALRTLVVHILKKVAYEYFGSASDLRQKLLPDIRERNEKEQAEIQRKELAKKNARRFRGRLKKNLPDIENLLNEVSSKDLTIEAEDDIPGAQEFINNIDQKLSDLKIVGAPARLGAAEEDYRQFRSMYAEIQRHKIELEGLITQSIERIRPSSPEAIARSQLNSLAGKVQSRLTGWKKSIDAINRSESVRVDSLFKDRSKAFHSLAMPLVEKVSDGILELDHALKMMSKIQQELDFENENTFQSYIDALELMSDNINIELIARQGVIENTSLKDELNRLHQVAQLGVTVEILGHELNSNERMIREGIRQIKSVGDVPGTHLVEDGFDALSHQLEFLSPLKVSGIRSRRSITGKEIIEYLKGFFDTVAYSRRISISATSKFEELTLKDVPSRIFPVFVNLVNNSIYWLINSHTEDSKVLLSIVDGNVVVSDNGPGIDPVDQEGLFNLFFTRKTSGGRGIGLYLCRANLLASGHRIAYSTEKRYQCLPGANFVIELKGNFK
ncbi:ATP-binding protein [Gilvimarinus polysaccharolyticus]|uniref:ATP-binding protein n=1 Tax=Gilvimarinus polysaccharolyticus TaxID=863921 RepID=UPI0006730F79|nr:ATP-binding protein [Gilvimarinus polysaccharolyticus]